MRMRRKKNLIPRMEKCADVMIKEPQEYYSKWRTLMCDAKALHVEIGCGKGGFVTQMAKDNPDVLFVAIEKDPSALLLAMEKTVALKLKNVFFINGDAVNLREIFAPTEVDLIYINFCDPWPPKNRHRRRLTYRAFLDIYFDILKAGGEIHMKTDNRPLFDFSIDEINQSKFTLTYSNFDLHRDGCVGVMTEYETRFYEQGLPIHRLEAKKPSLDE